MSNEQRVDELLNKAANDFTAHLAKMHALTQALTREVWEHLDSRLMGLGEEVDVSDATYVFTGVSVFLLATHVLTLVQHKQVSLEFAQKQVLDNFVNWYNQTINTPIPPAEDVPNEEPR